MDTFFDAATDRHLAVCSTKCSKIEQSRKVVGDYIEHVEQAALTGIKLIRVRTEYRQVLTGLQTPALDRYRR